MLYFPDRTAFVLWANLVH